MTRLETSSIKAEDRMDFWRDAICRNILEASVDPRADAHLEAAMVCAELGPLGMRRVVGGSHIYRRDRSDVRLSDPETIQLGIPSHGTSILVQDGREAVLKAGDMVLYDSSRPFTIAMQSRYQWHVFLLPKAKVRRAAAELSELTAIPMNVDRGVPAVTSRFLLDLSLHGDELARTADPASLGETAADLIASLVRSELGGPWAVTEPDEVLRQRAMHEIITRHDEADLDPGAIAVAIGVSVRTLHQLFANSGASVMERLRDHRLDRASRDLADPRLAGYTVASISKAHGFASAASFARAFRDSFGLTATEFRQAARDALSDKMFDGQRG